MWMEEKTGTKKGDKGKETRIKELRKDQTKRNRS